MKLRDYLYILACWTLLVFVPVAVITWWQNSELTLPEYLRTFWYLPAVVLGSGFVMWVTED